jgi:hypothetical protein
MRYLEDAWDNSPNLELIERIESKIGDLEKEISDLSDRLTHGDEAVRHATQHFLRSFRTLAATLRTASDRNIDNPERGDHPPKTINSS